MTVNQPRTVPRDGLANPTFDGMGQSEDLIVSLSFLPCLTDEQLRTAYRWVRSLGTSADLGDRGASPFVTGEPFIHEHLFHARIGNLRDPKAAVVSLIDELTAAGAGIQDGFFACWEPRPDGTMGPRRDPRAPREVRLAEAETTTSPFTLSDRVSEYIERLWNPALDPPESETEDDLKGGILVMDELVLEHRGAPVYFPGARIGYGLVPCEPLAADQRTKQVRLALVGAIEAAWVTVFKAPGKGALRPRPLNSLGSVDEVDKIVDGGRTGYLFSVEAITLLDHPSPNSCRFREYELLEAVFEAVKVLGLSPVITWQRFGTPLLVPPIKRPDSVEIQVWEQQN